MKYEKQFESERIIFIKLNEDLVLDYLNMVNDSDIQRLISHEKRTYSYDGEIDWINSKLKENAIIFSMIEKETNDFIGNIEIMNIRDNIGELGISITKDKQDRHYGQESIKRIIEYAFDTLGLNELELNVFSFNQRAYKCYEKVGFVNAGQGKAEDDIRMILKK